MKKTITRKEIDWVIKFKSDIYKLVGKLLPRNFTILLDDADCCISIAFPDHWIGGVVNGKILLYHVDNETESFVSHTDLAIDDLIWLMEVIYKDTKRSSAPLVEKYCLVLACIGSKDEIGEWTEEGNDNVRTPVIYETKEDAQKAYADSMIDLWADIRDGHKDFDDTDSDYYIALIENDGNKYKCYDLEKNHLFTYDIKTTNYEW